MTACPVRENFRWAAAHSVKSIEIGRKAQEPSLYLLERIKSIIVTLFSKVEAKEKKEAKLHLAWWHTKYV